MKIVKIFKTALKQALSMFVVKRSYLIFDEGSKMYYGTIQLHDKSWRQNCWTKEVENAYRYTKKEAKDLSTIWSVKMVRHNCA